MRKRDSFPELMTRRAMLSAMAGSCQLLASCRRSPSTVPPVTLRSSKFGPGQVLTGYSFHGRNWNALELDPSLCRLRLLLRGSDGAPLRDFEKMEEFEKVAGREVLCLMNAGMFEWDGWPVGICIEEGREVSPLNLRSGEGNFYLKPNGVFALTAAGAIIMGTEEWAADTPQDIFCATQSGPLFVQRGALHPALRENSTNLNIRNGIGVRGDGRIVLAISGTAVTFHEMALFFRDCLNCPSALYLDGAVSALHAPPLNIVNHARGLGPAFLISGPGR